MRKHFLYSLSLGVAAATLPLTAMIVPADGAEAQKKKKKKKKSDKEKPAAEQLSPLFIEPYNNALTALEAKDVPTLEANLTQAALFANSSDEKFRLGNAYVQLGGLQNSTDVQRKGLDLMLDSGKVNPADTARFNFLSGRFAYSASDFAAAEGRFKQAIDLGYTAENVELLYVDSVFSQDRIPEGLQLLKQTVRTVKAREGSVDESFYRRGVRRAYNANLKNETVNWTQMWVADYPSAESWRDALVIFRDFSNFDLQTNVDLMRLMRATNSLASERDYAEYIENADPRRLPGEVVKVIEEGIASGALSSTSEFFGEQLTAAQSRVDEDRSSLGSGESSARNSSNPRIAIGTADAYLGYGNFPKAAELYGVALQKPGVDTDLVNTRLGISNAMMGDWNAANLAFAKVAGPRKDLANFWMIWVNNQTKNSAADTSAPAAG